MVSWTSNNGLRYLPMSDRLYQVWKAYRYNPAASIGQVGWGQVFISRPTPNRWARKKDRD